MPKVTPEHAQAQRTRILDAARACFLRDGFHATSMQDILRQAGLSSGAFYLYFRSKDEVVAAIAGEAVTALAGVFADLASIDHRHPIDEVLRMVLERAMALDANAHVFPIAVQAWAESVRSPTLAALLHDIYLEAAGTVEAFLAVYQENGLVGNDLLPREQAAVILTMVQGFITHRVMFGELDPATFQAGLRSLLRPA